MPEYLLAIICLFILTASGVMDGPCRAVGIRVFDICFLLLSVLALSRFEVCISVEVTFSAAVAAMVFLPLLLIRGGKENNGGAIAAVVLFSAVIALLERSGSLYGAANGVLCGLFAGLSGVLLWDCPYSAAFSATAIPVFVRVIDAFITMAGMGYASIALDNGVLASQLIALLITMLIIWITALSSGERVRTE